MKIRLLLTRLTLRTADRCGMQRVITAQAAARRLPESTLDPLPGGFCAGEELYYTGRSQTFENRDCVIRGTRGVVAGEATALTQLPHTCSGCRAKSWSCHVGVS